MDVQMPLMDGLQATRKIRELEKSGGSHVPIVAMTAYAMKGDRQRCLEAGMDDYISKPFRSEDIVQMLECYGTGCAPLASRAGMPFPAGTSGPVEKKCQALIFDRAGLLARIGGQEDLVDTFVGMFVSLVEKSLPRFETAVTEKDGERVRGELHAMKGAAANIGADRMLSLLAELQAGTKTGDLEKIVDAAPTLRQEFEQFKTSTMTTTDGR
jgi:HPt (histidine-containing phosphotransfer) domain-containing protein